MHLASGQTLLCRAAVYTPANRRPVLPAWVRPLLAPGAAAEAGSAAGRQQEGPIQQIQPQLPDGILTADAVHVGAAADLDGQQLVVVGGGMSAGLLAAGAAERGARVHLLCRRCACADACRHFGGRAGPWGGYLGTPLQCSCLRCAAGTDACKPVASLCSSVHLIVSSLVCSPSRPLKPQPFETEVGWWGAKQLNGYRSLESPARRITACRRARG